MVTPENVMQLIEKFNQAKKDIITDFKNLNSENQENVMELIEKYPLLKNKSYSENEKLMENMMIDNLSTKLLDESDVVVVKNYDELKEIMLKMFFLGKVSDWL